MITVVVGDNEIAVQKMLSRILGMEGNAFAAGGENFIRVIRKDDPVSGAIPSLEERIIELQDELFDGKKPEVYKSILEKIERTLIEHVLEKTEGNQLKAARILGINRNTIRSKVKKFGIDAKRWKVM